MKNSEHLGTHGTVSTELGVKSRNASNWVARILIVTKAGYGAWSGGLQSTQLSDLPQLRPLPTYIPIIKCIRESQTD